MYAGILDYCLLCNHKYHISLSSEQTPFSSLSKCHFTVGDFFVCVQNNLH